MEYTLYVGLTFLLAWYILRVVAKKKEKPYSRAIHRQSDMHRAIKGFFSKEINNGKVSSQLQKRRDGKNVNVIVIEQKAYWVVDNTFFVADAIDGQVRRETAEPVNTESMSGEDIDKMWFILDHLESRENNDSGGAGNS